MELTCWQKAAIIVAALDSNTADRLLDQLDNEAAQRIRNSILALESRRPGSPVAYSRNSWRPGLAIARLSMLTGVTGQRQTLPTRCRPHCHTQRTTTHQAASIPGIRRCWHTNNLRSLQQ